MEIIYAVGTWVVIADRMITRNFPDPALIAACFFAVCGFTSVGRRRARVQRSLHSFIARLWPPVVFQYHARRASCRLDVHSSCVCKETRHQAQRNARHAAR
jgi:hypothetical protein